MEKYHEPETLKEAFERLDEVLSRLENGEEELEKAFETYEEGLKLIKYANAQIDRVEKKCLIVNEDGETDEF